MRKYSFSTKQKRVNFFMYMIISKMYALGFFEGEGRKE